MANRVGVLFVCLGNICRSPMAEAVFRQMVREEGLEDRVVIDSAGTGDWHTGNPPHEGTRNLLDQYKISYEGQTARKVAMDDFKRFDYIVAMDDKNVTDLRYMEGKSDANVVKLLDLVPESQVKNVPDPYFTGNFEEVYEMVERGCRILLDRVKEKLE